MKAALFALALAVGACVSSNSVQCADGTFCPTATACAVLTDPTSTVCASHDQVAACAGMPDGTACSTQADSQCRDGVCWPFRCGDGRVDSGEACDDGNTLDGDGCSSTCASTEVCGNGIADPVHRIVAPDNTVTIVPLEQCDDGNFADHDGCNTHCELELPGWNQLVPIGPSAFFGGAMAYDADHAHIVMFGDNNVVGGGTWLWDGVEWLPTHPVTSPGPLTDTAMAYDADTRHVVLFGGSNGSVETAGTWEWDGQSWIKHAVANPPPARAVASMAYDSARKRVVLFGGIYTNQQSQQGVTLGDTWEWDGAQWSEVTPSGAPDPRGGAAMVYDPVHGVIVMFGGAPAARLGRTTPNAETWTYDGTAWSQLTPATAPAPRVSAMIAWDAASQRVVLYGGNDGSGTGSSSMQDMWSWDGTTWTPIAATNPPGAADSIMMAGDPVRGRVLLFGANQSRTWEWTGSAWLDVSPDQPQIPNSPAAFDAHRGRAVLFNGSEAVETTGPDWFTSSILAPGQRTQPALAYDPKRRVTVLFGGSGVLIDTSTNDTWTWDGATWTPMTVTSPPPPRSGAAMVYDRAHDQIVLVGGVDDNGTLLPDTWVWDGASWHDAAPAHAPPPRAGFALGYDEKRERVILFGGGPTDSDVLADTWSWDGHDWTALTPMAEPEPRIGAALAWNAPRQHLILFGGSASDQVVTVNDAWEWDGKNWLSIPATNPPPARQSPVAFPSPHGVYIAGGGELSPFHDVWELTWSSPRPTESCRLDVDDDLDGKASCADPDCGYWCATCGDGTCDPLETCHSCPGDCTCTAVCGDAFCDAPETHASCPGDCP